MRPTVNVFVPCYRYGHFLEQCVETAIAQSGVNVRVLIIDDASPDDSREVGTDLALRHSNVQFIQHLTNKGHIATYNEGIEWASEGYFLILSADDYLLPGALEQATSLMEEVSDIGFTFGNAFALFDDGLMTPLHPLKKVPEACKRRIFRGTEFIVSSGGKNIVPTPTAIVRTSVQKQVGGYRHELPHSGDMEMWLRLAAHGSVGFIDSYQAVYRCHSNNMSRMYLGMPDLVQRKAAFDYFFEHHGSSLAGAGKLRKRTSITLARDALQYASAAFNRGQPGASEQLKQFSLEMHPAIKFSWPWAKLVCKRTIGLNMWHVLQPVWLWINRRAARKEP